MRRLLAAAAVLALAASAHASDLDRHARFEALFHGSDAYSADDVRTSGLHISGEKLSLENGSFTATVQQVSHPYFTMSNVAAKGVLPLDDAFFADAITAAVNDVIDRSTTTVGSFKNASAQSAAARVTITDMQLTFANKALSGSLHAVVATPQFKGHASYDKASRAMTVTVESVKIAGIPVPLSVAFFTMNQFMSYPFVKLQNPNIIVDLKPFLPGAGK